MNLAAAATEQTESTVSQTVPVVVLGTDALLAAAPYTAVQLAHACLQAGYASVVPASWGDELIAAGVMRRLPRFGYGPAIQCSCPIVAHRLLTTGGDLRPVMLPMVSPPVALARYLRAVSHPTRVRITYVGSCPGAVDESIDIRMSPETLIGMLAERQIVLDEQPRVFESIIPPDRRRYYSQPGGVPSAERLWSDLGSRALVEVESDDFVSEIGDHLLAGEHVLMDVAARLGCVCSGAVPGTPPREARAGVVALEPPRSTAAVVEEQTPLDLDLPIPAVPRTPVDVALAGRTPASSPALPPLATPSGHRATPTVTEPRPPRAPSPPAPRPIAGSVPTARHAEGKSLPRAYVARRRQSTPRSQPTVPTNPADRSSSREQSGNDEQLTSTTVILLDDAIANVDAGMAARDGDPTIATNAPSTEPATTPESAALPPLADTASSPPSSAEPKQLGDAPTVENELGPEIVDDRHQLHLDGMSPAGQERLPIFTPSPAATPTRDETPPPNVAPAFDRVQARPRSRVTVYVVAAIIALLLVAGLAYLAGRSVHAPSTPTEQLP